MSYCVHPEVFFLIENDKILLWDCLHHQQYLLTVNYFLELLKIHNSQNPIRSKKFLAFQEGGIIAKNEELQVNLWEFDILSRLFHIGTKNVPSEEISNNPKVFFQNYLQECKDIEAKVPNFFQEKTTEIVDLPMPSLQALDLPFSSVLKNRKTSRLFHGKSITSQQISDVLYASFGLIHGTWEEFEMPGFKIAGLRKSSPASGGLHAEEAYLVVFNIQGLEKGLYYYRPQDHKLNLLALGDFEDVSITFNKNQFYSKGMSFGIYITARLDKYWWKYQHSRTYRTMLLDIGHVSQTFLLVATALGLSTWLTGVFDDGQVEKFLGIDGYKESVMLYVGAGHGDPATFHNIGH